MRTIQAVLAGALLLAGPRHAFAKSDFDAYVAEVRQKGMSDRAEETLGWLVRALSGRGDLQVEPGALGFVKSYRARSIVPLDVDVKGEQLWLTFLKKHADTNRSGFVSAAEADTLRAAIEAGLISIQLPVTTLDELAEGLRQDTAAAKHLLIRYTELQKAASAEPLVGMGPLPTSLLEAIAPPPPPAKVEPPTSVASAGPAAPVPPAAPAVPAAPPTTTMPTTRIVPKPAEAARARLPVLYFGMGTEALSRAQQTRLQVPDRQGAVVVDTIPGGPAALAGLQKDDVVRTVEEKVVTGSDGLTRLVDKSHRPGDTVKLGVWREAQIIDVSLTLADGIPFLTKACDEGAARACGELANSYLEGNAVPQDRSRAARLLEKACEGGQSCATLGYLYESGFGVGKDLARAVTLYKRACDGGRANSCFNLGVRYEVGRGVEKDEAHAAALYKQACDGGALSSCARLGAFYEVGRGGVEKDDSRAGDLYQQACDGGEPNGCAALARWLRMGGAEEPGTLPQP